MGAPQIMTLGPQLFSSSIGQFVGYEGVSEAYGIGAPLILDGNQLDTAAADPTSGLVGLSAKAASGVTGAVMPYIPFLEGIVFEGNLITGGANPPTNYTLLVTDIHNRYALQVDTSQTPDVWYVDQGDTTAVSVTVIGFRDPPGTVDARVYFVVNADVTVYAT